MHLVYRVLGTAYALVAVPLGVFFLFFYWPREVEFTHTEIREGKMYDVVEEKSSWWLLMLIKMGVALILASCYLLLSLAFDFTWPSFGRRLSESMLLAATVGLGVGVSVYVVVARRKLREWANTKQDPGPGLAEEVISKGPAEAVESKISAAIFRTFIRRRYGWLALAIYPATVAFLLTVEITHLWGLGFMPWAESVHSSASAAEAAFAHVAVYAAWGFFALYCIAVGVADLIHGDSESVYYLGGAVFFIATLAVYIAIAGLWI